METKIKYEKPAMEFVELRSKEAVANTCWGYHGTNTHLYCDIPGEGYVSFQIGAGSCTLNLINVMYYSDENSNGTDATQEQIEILKNILKKSGGNSGNPYDGEGTTVIPDKPSQSWS